MYSHASSSETVLRNTKRFMSMRPTCPCFFREGHNFLNLDLTLICTTKEYMSNQAFSVTCTFVCICSVTFPPAPTNIKAFVLKTNSLMRQWLPNLLVSVLGMWAQATVVLSLTLTVDTELLHLSVYLYVSVCVKGYDIMARMHSAVL